MRKIRLLVTFFMPLLFIGCASVSMESKEKSDLAKEFNVPTGDSAGLYIYRDSVFGGALKKDIRVDGECVGESAPKTFFYKEVTGSGKHIISTESEFSPNDLVIDTEAGKNYFIRQFIKMGLFVGGAGVELVDKAKGKDAVAKLEMASSGNCSK